MAKDSELLDEALRSLIWDDGFDSIDTKIVLGTVSVGWKIFVEKVVVEGLRAKKGTVKIGDVVTVMNKVGLAVPKNLSLLDRYIE